MHFAVRSLRHCEVKELGSLQLVRGRDSGNKSSGKHTLDLCYSDESRAGNNRVRQVVRLKRGVDEYNIEN